MKIKVLYKQVGKPAEVREIEDDYKVLQELCGGCFSASAVTSFVPLWELRNVFVYYHDTGKLIGLPFNCFIGSEPLVGNVVFYAYDAHGDGIDLTENQITVLALMLACEHVVVF